MSRQGLLLVAASVVVVIAVAAGFIVMGSPGEERKRDIDRIRTARLSEIENDVTIYYQDHGRLPARLADLSGTGNRLGPARLSDPESKESYGYEVTGERTYRLCATFAQASEDSLGEGYEDGQWYHPAGRHCFDLILPNWAESKKVPMPARP